MRIGIMGGTFDPIHNGHIKCAQEVKAATSLDKVLFIPTGKPPHKIARRISSADDRIAMISAAVCGMDGFDVSDIEIKRKKYTYTYDTLLELRSIYPEDELFMIIGADTLADIVNWHRALDVFELCTFIAMKRPGADYHLFNEYLETAVAAGADVLPVDISETDVSSTMVRQNVIDGKDIGALVPSSVENYILRHDLYKKIPMSYEFIATNMKELLSEERYVHCLNVADECVRLGRIYGVSDEKCRLAGILHDVGKELTDKQYFWLGVKLSNDDYNGKKVLRHAAAGAILAKGLYNIDDADVLEAIECHITGRPNMGILAKLVFIADYTEKDRIGEQFDAVRALANAGKLDEAILLQCDNTLIYNIQRGSVHICTQTVRTRNWILSLIKDREVTNNG